MVFPEESLIVVSTAWKILDDSAPRADFVKRILPAVHDHSCGASK